LSGVGAARAPLSLGPASADDAVDAIAWDGDGELAIYPGGASGFVTPPVASSLGHVVRDLAVGDVDGDGAAELVTATPAGVALASRGADPVFTMLGLVTGEPCRRVLLGHVDRDERLDFIVLGEDETEVQVWLGRGAEPAVLASRHTFAGEPDAIALADYNADGVADLLLGDKVGTSRALLGRGDGTFAAPARTTASRAKAFRVGDVTGDGRSDAVWFDGNDMFYLPARKGLR
jgi:hypothetical protein